MGGHCAQEGNGAAGDSSSGRGCGPALPGEDSGSERRSRCRLNGEEAAQGRPWLLSLMRRDRLPSSHRPPPPAAPPCRPLAPVSTCHRPFAGRLSAARPRARNTTGCRCVQVYPPAPSAPLCPLAQRHPSTAPSFALCPPISHLWGSRHQARCAGRVGLLAPGHQMPAWLSALQQRLPPQPPSVSDVGSVHVPGNGQGGLRGLPAVPGKRPLTLLHD